MPKASSLSILIACCFTILSLYLQSILNLGIDIAIAIDITHRITNGQHLYRDFFEVTPPMIFYLELPVIFLAWLFHCSDMVAAALYHTSIALLSLALCYRLLHIATSRQHHLLMIFLYFSLLLLPIVIPANQFGQREHFFIMLTMPYFISIFCWPEGNPPYPLRLKISIGLLAGIGFCIKPFFVLALIVSELMRLSWSRQFKDLFRIETTIIAVLLMSYLLLVVLLLPEYFTRTLPFISHSYLFYTTFNNSYIHALLMGALYLSGGGIIFMPIVAFFIKAPQQRYLMALTITMFAIAAMQMKGWSYHLYPYGVIYSLMIPFILTDVIINRQKLKENHPRVALEYGSKLLILCCFTCTLAGYYPFLLNRTIMDRNTLPTATAQLDSLVDHTKPDLHFFCFCTAGQSEQPLFNQHSYQNVTLFEILWPVSAIENALDYYAGNPEKQRDYLRLKQQFIHDTVNSLITTKPDILIKEKTQSMKWGKQIDIFDYFAADPRFNQELTHYAIRGQVMMPHSILTIYQRSW